MLLIFHIHCSIQRTILNRQADLLNKFFSIFPKLSSGGPYLNTGLYLVLLKVCFNQPPLSSDVCKVKENCRHYLQKKKKIYSLSFSSLFNKRGVTNVVSWVNPDDNISRLLHFNATTFLCVIITGSLVIHSQKVHIKAKAHPHPQRNMPAAIDHIYVFHYIQKDPKIWADLECRRKASTKGTINLPFQQFIYDI